MAYIFGLIVVALFFVVLHYFTELKRREKIAVSSVLFAIIFGAIAYNSYADTQREKMLQVVTKFEQGKTIKCMGKDVNATNYDLSVGTYTFIGKEKTSFYGEMISATSCE